MHHRWLIIALALVAAGCARAAGDDVDGGSDSAQVADAAEEQAADADAPTPAVDTGARSEADAAAPAATREDPSLGRPAEITLTIAGHRNYAGTYRAAGTSNTCGPQRSPATGEPSDAFAVQFPASADAGDGEIPSLEFYADTLPVGGGTTTRYKLDVGLRTKGGGRPAGFIVNTTNPGSEPGTATVTTDGGTSRLVVRGRNFYGTVEMTVLCKPKAG